MFSKPARPSRNSLAYMCMTMSLSSAWMTPRPPFFASTWKTSQMSPKSTMRPLRDGRDVGGEDLHRGMAGLDRLAELAGHVGRQVALHHGVQRPVAGAAVGRSRRPCAPRSPPARSVPCMTRVKSMMVVVPPSSAARPTTEGPWVSVGSPLGTTTRPEAMGMRVDAAGHDDLAGGVDQPRAGREREGAAFGDRHDLAAGDRHIGRADACGVTTQSPVMTRSTMFGSRLCYGKRCAWSRRRASVVATRLRSEATGSPVGRVRPRIETIGARSKEHSK